VNAGDAIAWYLAFVLSTTAHEAAHALVAYLGGDPTAYEGGQVSLNPLPHMQREPVGMVLMPLLSVFYMGWAFGWASTPFDPVWEQRHPRRAAWMAAAGPAANLVLAFLALVALHIGLALDVFYLFPYGPRSISFLVGSDFAFAENAGRFLAMLLFLNTLLCVFNLLPVPPLDGASALGLLLPPERVRVFKESLMHGGVASLLFILIFLFFGRIFVKPLWQGIQALVYLD
jgi:Zn-dependent protease